MELLPLKYFAAVPEFRFSTWPILVVLVVGLGCTKRSLRKSVANESIYQTAFSGWVVADALTGERLLERNADQLFTPASNTKILTLATALAWLPDAPLPALAYRYDGDTLRLWGTAYPLLAADKLEYNQAIKQTLANHNGPVEASVHGYAMLPRFGSGWMWDDYAGIYARERSGLPVYANLARTWLDSDSVRETIPDFLVVSSSSVLPKGVLQRKEGSNRFRASAKTNIGDTLYAPLYDAQGMTTQLLEDWTGRSIRYHAAPLPVDWRTRTWNGQHRDSLLRAMMLPSDNFLAEQLLLQAGLYQHDITNADRLRATSLEEVFNKGFSKQIKWTDASGLSHYNLISPASLEAILRQLHHAHPDILRLFARGGEDQSTLADHYSLPGEASWLWAKTGTLRHNHCLSGYLLADSGRLLTFSFMHNHYAGGSGPYKSAMERSLRQIKAAY